MSSSLLGVGNHKTPFRTLICILWSDYAFELMFMLFPLCECMFGNSEYVHVDYLAFNMLFDHMQITFMIRFMLSVI